MRPVNIAKGSAEMMLLFASLLLCLVIAGWHALRPDRPRSGGDGAGAFSSHRHQPR